MAIPAMVRGGAVAAAAGLAGGAALGTYTGLRSDPPRRDGLAGLDARSFTADVMMGVGAGALTAGVVTMMGAGVGGVTDDMIGRVMASGIGIGAVVGLTGTGAFLLANEALD